MVDLHPAGRSSRRVKPDFRLRWWGLLTSVGLVVCSATILGFFGRYWWFFDLFAHFRVQYFLGLAALCLVFFLGCRRKTAAAFVLLAALNLVQFLPLYFGSPPPAPPTDRVMRAMLINVNTQSGDPVRVRAAVESWNPDLLVLEEVSDRWMAELDWLRRLHPYSVVEPREDNFGIAIFTRLPLVEGEVVYIGSAGAPSIAATLQTEDGPMEVLATHPLPPAGREYSGWRNEQLDLLPEHIDASRPFLLIGDLNTTP
jgi:endonuclease/exonuclease/phosphatase (EEP) superfamily protein YafD